MFEFQAKHSPIWYILHCVFEPRSIISLYDTKKLEVSVFATCLYCDHLDRGSLVGKIFWFISVGSQPTSALRGDCESHAFWRHCPRCEIHSEVVSCLSRPPPSGGIFVWLRSAACRLTGHQGRLPSPPSPPATTQPPCAQRHNPAKCCTKICLKINHKIYCQNLISTSLISL